MHIFKALRDFTSSGRLGWRTERKSGHPTNIDTDLVTGHSRARAVRGGDLRFTRAHTRIHWRTANSEFVRRLPTRTRRRRHTQRESANLTEGEYHTYRYTAINPTVVGESFVEMAGEKRSQDQDETLLARTVLVDIEGTTTSISFVKVKHKGEETERDNDNARRRLATRLHRIVSFHIAPFWGGPITNFRDKYSTSLHSAGKIIWVFARFVSSFLSHEYIYGRIS